MISAVRQVPGCLGCGSPGQLSRPRSNPVQACLANKSFIPVCKHEGHGQIFNSLGPKVQPGVLGAQHLEVPYILSV